jgi:hypothetical protein
MLYEITKLLMLRENKVEEVDENYLARRVG